MAERSEKSDGKDASKLLGKYLAMFTESWEYAQQNYHTIWENNWKLYRNIRTQHNYPSTVETFVPMVNSTVRTLFNPMFGLPTHSVHKVCDEHDNGQVRVQEVLGDAVGDFCDFLVHSHCAILG